MDEQLLFELEMEEEGLMVSDTVFEADIEKDNGEMVDDQEDDYDEDYSEISDIDPEEM